MCTIHTLFLANIPTNIFQCCRVSVPAARVSTVEAMVAAYLHPVGLQRPSGSNVGLDTEGVSLHQPPSGTRMEANSAPLEVAVWRHQVGCWRPELVKRNIRWHRGGCGYKRVGSEEVSLQRPTSQHFRRPTGGCWCYVCRDIPQKWEDALELH